MSTDSNRKSSGQLGSADGAPDLFRDSIEERYSEWERAFGDEVDERRTLSFDPKKQ